jgi:hypothetical protein
MKKLLIFALLLSGCVTLQGKGEVVDKKNDIYTIKYFTGNFPEMYSSAFENTAKELCRDEYIVIEKSYTPKTLTIFEDYYFYWVIKCSP